MKAIKSYAAHFKNKKYLEAVLRSLVFIAIALVVNFYAGTYALEKISNPVTDLILSNIPVFDVDALFLYGPIVLTLLITALCLKKPERIPFVVSSVALFLVIRSVFVTLTHIGPFPTRATIDYSTRIVRDLTFGGDLFFSGHTGLPYLMALIFWQNKFWRYFFIATSIFFGIVVLLGHLHYSIDVLAAFFITYSIYHIAVVFFRQEKKFFDRGVPRNDQSISLESK